MIDKRMKLREGRKMKFAGTRLPLLISCFLFISFIPLSSSSQSRLRGAFYPGDAVRVIAWQMPGLGDGSLKELGISNDYTIDMRGRIFLPLLGYVNTVGLSAISLADTLASNYSVYAQGITFVCKPLIRLQVLGAVDKPGSYLFEKTISLWEAIGAAGGPETIADFRKMYFVRQGTKVSENLLDNFEQAHTLEEIGIKTGDQLYLPQKKSLRVQTILNYISFSASLILLYLQIDERRK